MVLESVPHMETKPLVIQNGITINHWGFIWREPELTDSVHYSPLLGSSNLSLWLYEGPWWKAINKSVKRRGKMRAFQFTTSFLHPSSQFWAGHFLIWSHGAAIIMVCWHCNLDRVDQWEGEIFSNWPMRRQDIRWLTQIIHQWCRLASGLSVLAWWESITLSTPWKPNTNCQQRNSKRQNRIWLDLQLIGTNSGLLEIKP